MHTETDDLFTYRTTITYDLTRMIGRVRADALVKLLKDAGLRHAFTIRVGTSDQGILVCYRVSPSARGLPRSRLFISPYKYSRGDPSRSAQ
jgi:hypothetical protein